MRFETAHGFVIMPFQQDPRTVGFWNAMTRAAERYEHLVIERFGSRSIGGGQELFTAIAEGIRASDFAIADFTLQDSRPNLNVLTEAGIALGTGKPLYLVSRGDYNKLKGKLPSDWRGYYIEAMPESDPDGDAWEDGFRGLFEKILRHLHRPLTPAQEKARQSDAQQLRWLMQFVDALQERCRALYDHERLKATARNWTGKWRSGRGLPSAYTFWMACPGRPGVTLDVGANFERWQRGGTPLGISAKESGQDATWTPIDSFVRPLREITTEEALDAAVEVIDRVIGGFLPDFPRPSTVWNAMAQWSGWLDNMKAALAARDGIIKVEPAAWTSDGCLHRCAIPGSPIALQVGVSTKLWAEHDQSACWVVVQPAEGYSPAVMEKELKLGGGVRRVDKDGQIAIPVPTKDILKTTGTLLDQVTKWARSLPVSATEEAREPAGEGAPLEPA